MMPRPYSNNLRWHVIICYNCTQSSSIDLTMITNEVCIEGVITKWSTISFSKQLKVIEALEVRMVRAVASVRQGGGGKCPPKFWTGSTLIDNELCFSVFMVIQNEKVFLFSVK